MMDRVRHINASARKRLCNRSPAYGRRLAVESRKLVNAGVRTPTADYDSASHELVFPWIDGVTAREWFRRCRETGGAGDWNGNRNELKALLEPIVAMHRCPRQGLTLEPLDPWRKIRPRLMASEEKELAEHNRWAWRLYRELLCVETRWGATLFSRGLVPVHGDFHVGQLLYEIPGNASWLIDLEDMALGRPESDMANLAAHWVTSQDLYRGGVFAAFEELASLLSDLYQDMSGRALESLGTSFYGATALLRRALKLWEHEADLTRVRSVLHAVDTLVIAMRRHQYG